MMGLLGSQGTRTIDIGDKWRAVAMATRPGVLQLCKGVNRPCKKVIKAGNIVSSIDEHAVYRFRVLSVNEGDSRQTIDRQRKKC